jgi:hypothetical protein
MSTGSECCVHSGLIDAIFFQVHFDTVLAQELQCADCRSVQVYPAVYDILGERHAAFGNIGASTKEASDYI